MSFLTVKEKRGVLYFFSVNPEEFAMGVYSVIMSLIGANLLWITSLLLCIYLDQANFARTVDKLIGIQIIYASITTFLWWLIYNEKGQNAATHINFYIWFVAKCTSAMIEIVFFPQYYLRVFNNATPGDLRLVLFNLVWGGVAIMMLEILGLLFAQKHINSLKARKNRTIVGKAYLNKAFNV